MFLVIILLAFVMHQVAAPPTSCGPDSVWHTDSRRTLDSLCCIPVTCSPGYGPNLCNSSGAEAFCTPCDLDWYNSKTLRSAPPGGGSMELCQPFTNCRERLHFEKSAGNATQDRECRCMDGKHMGTLGGCFDQCPPGKYWQKSEDLCVLCPNGMFTNTSGREECSPCTLCGKTKTECNATHDAECLSAGTNEATSEAGSGNKFQGWIIAVIVIVVLIPVVGALVLFICKKKHGEWLWCRKSSSRSEDTQRRYISSADNGESERMLQNGRVLVNNGQPDNPEQPVLPDNHDPPDNQEQHDPPDNQAEPDLPDNQAEPLLPDDRVEPDLPDNQAEPYLPDDRAEPYVPNNRAEPDLPDNRAEPDLPDNRVEPDPPNNRVEPDDVLRQRTYGATPPYSTLCQNLDQSSGDRNGLLASGSTPINAKSGQDRGDVGQTGALDTVDRPARHSSQSGPLTLQEDQRDAVQNKKVKRYDNAIQSSYNDIQKTLILDNTFLGALLSKNVITELEHDQLRALRKQYDGNAEALSILRKALRRNGDKACDPFLEALLEPESRQDVIALIIDRERAEHLIRERDNHADDVAPDRIGRSKSVEDPGKENLTSTRDSVDHSNGTKTISEETRVKEVDGSLNDSGPKQRQLKEFHGSEDDPGSKKTQLKELYGSGDDPGSKETQLKEFYGSGDNSGSKETQLKEFHGSEDDPGSKETQLKRTNEPQP